VGEASKAQAKKEKKPSKVGAVLNKRVGSKKAETGLKRDVKTPGWLKAIGGYFTGSYRELRQVKWPNRRASWSLTFAVLVFTAVLVVFILSLDYGFEQLFKKVIL
jgi:preprotein translocase SecE subunit